MSELYRALTREERMEKCGNCPYVRGRLENEAVRPDNHRFLEATSWLCYIADYIIWGAPPEHVNKYIVRHGDPSINCPKKTEITDYKFLT